MGMQVIVDNDDVRKLEDYSFVSTDIPGSLEDLWNLEAIGIRDEQNPISDDDALEQFNKTVKFDDGHYQVTFPWNSNKEMLPNNRNLAERRLSSLVHRMQRLNRHEFLKKYDQVFKDQLQKGVIEVVDDECTSNALHYLPHHGVETPQKATTKLRIVYDASAKEFPHLPSLNEYLEKAFLQVGLQEQERDVTRFLWIKDLTQPAAPNNIICLRFARVPFGVNASPFLLGATVEHHLNHHTSTVAKKICKDLYSDNVITGTDNMIEADQFYKESKQLFTKAGMKLREFASNNEEFMSHLPEVDRVKEDTIKVLGVRWQRSSDQLSIQVPDDFPTAITKKLLLSKLFKVYDPLGFVCPVTIRGKMMLQTLCKKKVSWNEVVSPEDINNWVSLTEDLKKVGEVMLPRYIGFDVSKSSRLMCFVDASENAYAAVIYLQDGINTSHLIFAKARVSPLKKKSIPRLELMAVVIGVRAVVFIREKLAFNGRIVLWSDSQCVLRWLQTRKVTGTFVTNRLKEIRKEKDIEFRYVPSKENPADIASRGASFDTLTDFWWHGPAWSCSTEDKWPIWEDNPNKLQIDHCTETQSIEMGMPVIPAKDRSVFDMSLTRFSTFSKAVRITAWCLRFIGNLRNKKTRQNSEFLQPDEVRTSTVLLVKVEQQKEFSDLITCIKRRQKHTTVAHLGVVIDKDEILRCHGRLGNMKTGDDAKFPILLPSKGRLTELIIQEFHVKSMHAKVPQTLAAIRQSFWIPRGRSRVKMVISNCQVCRLYDGGPFPRPEMPDLPESRVTRSDPFLHIGLDYFGPLLTRKNRHSTETCKRWVCIFTCFSTRAIHLEIVDDQSSEEFLLAIRRFVARRGKPDTILSDNATQFKAVMSSNALNLFVSQKAIKWTFIPEYAPWAGGVYERLIRNVKSAMKKTIGKCLLNDSQLHTIVTEVENVVNSRPITYIGDDINDWSPLTPNKLLGIRAESFVPAENDANDPSHHQGPFSTREAIVTLYKRHFNVIEEFWRIWENDYLLSLREKTHWGHKDPRLVTKAHPTVGQVVLIKSHGYSRNNWKIGRVESLCKSHDNAVRAARIQLPSKKIIIRPVNHLHPLETSCEPEKTNEIVKNHDVKSKVNRPVRKAARLARSRWQSQLDGSDTSSVGSVAEDQTP